MPNHLVFHLSDLITLLLEAQRHALLGDTKAASKVVASAHTLLQQGPRAG